MPYVRLHGFDAQLAVGNRGPFDGDRRATATAVSLQSVIAVDDATAVAFHENRWQRVDDVREALHMCFVQAVSDKHAGDELVDGHALHAARLHTVECAGRAFGRIRLVPIPARAG